MRRFALFNNLYYLALNHTSAINAAIEQASMPLLVFAANFLLFGQRVSAGQIIGFFVSILGVSLVATNGSLAGLLRLDVGYGDAMLLLAINGGMGNTDVGVVPAKLFDLKGGGRLPLGNDRH